MINLLSFPIIKLNWLKRKKEKEIDIRNSKLNILDKDEIQCPSANDPLCKARSSWSLFTSKSLLIIINISF